MRRLLLLLTVILVMLVIVFRDRLYLRDPLGKLERNGAPITEARVFINYSNDVLVQEDQGRRMFVVQNWNHAAATPPKLTCIQGMLCLTPADRVDAQATPGTSAQAQMSSREVLFTDSDGAHVHVTIR